MGLAVPDAGRDVFRHVILTRFSVRFTGSQEPPSEEWLRYRLGFFAEGTAASMRAQRTRPDRWLVFCDADSPGWLREALEELGEGLFDVVWLDEPWGHTVLRRAVAAVADRPFLITTRLDSDDVLGVDFVTLVQGEFRGQTSMYINLLCGLQLDRSGQFYRYDYPQNAFISYVEKLSGEPRTVFQQFQHGRSLTMAPVRNVVSQWAWVQVIHGGNLSNYVRGPRVSPRKIPAVIEMDLDYDRTTTGVRLLLQWAASWVKLWGRWLIHPKAPVAYAKGQWLRWRGTTTLEK